jgi:hypothetical protein
MSMPHYCTLVLEEKNLIITNNFIYKNLWLPVKYNACTTMHSVYQAQNHVSLSYKLFC